MLYCGFVKYNLPNSPRVWMRTYGAHHFNVPNLARLTDGHHQGKETMDAFENIMQYMLNSGACIAPGHTLELAGTMMRARAPRSDEPFLTDSPGETLVLEPA